MRKSNLTYEQLIELAPKDRPFQVEIEFLDKVLRTSWAMLSPVLKVDYEQKQINVEYELFIQDYRKRLNSITPYSFNGLLTLIDEYSNMYEKPEEIKLRTKVMILENAKEIEEGFEQETYIGKIGKIQLIQDDYRGLWYGIAFDEGDYWIGFPHYCVRPVERVEEKEEIITVNGKKYKLIEE